MLGFVAVGVAIPFIYKVGWAILLWLKPVFVDSLGKAKIKYRK